MIKTVMVVAKHLIYGGSEKYTLNLVNSLAARGIKVVLITGDGPLISHVSHRVKVFILPISRKLRIKQCIEKKILEIAREYKPQIIHTQCRTSMLCSQLARNMLDIPLITHEHHMYNQKDYPFIISELKEGSDFIITIGPYTRKAIIKYGYNKDQIKSILNGVNLQDLPPITKKERELARINFNFKTSDQIVLCISRVVNGKGLDKLIMGFKTVTKKHKNARLLIVGDDEEYNLTRQALKKLVNENRLDKKVSIFTGEYNIRKYHAVADIFCYPALCKGMSVMEAMASELPIVGKRTNKKPLVVEHMVSGLMTEGTQFYKIDPGEIADKISYLLQRPRLAKRMGQAARKKIEEKYTIDKHIVKIINVYRMVVKNNYKSVYLPDEIIISSKFTTLL